MSTLVLVLQSRPVIVLVAPEQCEQQIVAHGLTMEHLDSPENFARKVQRAGPRGVRYEASTDQDRQTRELMRLVLALKIQNDQLVAATRYLAKEAGKWQHSAPPQLHLLTQLEQGIIAASPVEQL